MLKRLLNEFVLEFDLELQGRLIVKEPEKQTAKRAQINKADKQIAQSVTTILPDGTCSIYLPGASLKGAMRAQAERIARTLNRHDAGACDPFVVLPRNGTVPPSNLACTERILARTRRQTALDRNPTSLNGSEPELITSQLYTDVCPICRTFGHVGWGRRLRITDFYPIAEDPLKSVELTHIGVDRVSGGVANGQTFTMQYAFAGALRGKLILENFELWQLGLIGFLWKDMVDGLLQLGHKQSSGAGQIIPKVHRAVIHQFGAKPEDGRLSSVGKLYSDAATYGYEERTLKGKLFAWQGPIDGVRWEVALTQSQLLQVWNALEKQTAQSLRDHSWPETMIPERLITRVSGEVTSNGREAPNGEVNTV